MCLERIRNTMMIVAGMTKWLLGILAALKEKVLIRRRNERARAQWRPTRVSWPLCVVLEPLLKVIRKEL